MHLQCNQNHGNGNVAEHNLNYIQCSFVFSQATLLALLFMLLMLLFVCLLCVCFFVVVFCDSYSAYLLPHEKQNFALSF